MKIENQQRKLAHWARNGFNVLFIGPHGVGKTAMVKDTFESLNLKYLYYSASTMDPWVDFVGVPTQHKMNQLPASFETIRDLIQIDAEHSLAKTWVMKNWEMSGDDAKKIVDYVASYKEGPKYLELVRPEAFATDDIEALFFDEFNRSQKKVRNSVMELIQFKSINGKKFPKLRMVWAAINPEDEDAGYQVEELDPAQLDRFEVKVEVSNKPNKDWFTEKFGKTSANAVCEFWDGLPPEIKKIVSPRRLEYVLRMKSAGGDIRDVLPQQANPQALSKILDSGSTLEKLEKLLEERNIDGARKFMSNENNYTAAIRYIAANVEFMKFFIPLLPKEKISVCLDSQETETISNFIVEQSSVIPIFNSICKEILKANVNGKLIKKIKANLTKNKAIADAFEKLTNNEVPVEPVFAPNLDGKNWPDSIKEIKKVSLTTAQGRSQVINLINQNIPKEQSANESLVVLEVLNNMSKHFDKDVVPNEDMINNLCGIINNCIASFHKGTGENFNALVTKYGHIVSDLFNYINTVNCAGKINKIA